MSAQEGLGGWGFGPGSTAQETGFPSLSLIVLICKTI